MLLSASLGCNEIAVNERILDSEFGGSMRTVMRGWNVSIAKWLRFIIYERASTAPVLTTYLFSAVWHGFYPGHYIALLTCGLVIVAGRWVRRKVRPYFTQKGVAVKLFYDTSTFVATRAATLYCWPPFVLLGLKSTFVFYKSIYFGGHILALTLIVFLRYIPSPKTTSENRFSTNCEQNKPQQADDARPIADSRRVEKCD